VSSYTPTLGTLLALTKARSAGPHQDFAALLVAQAVAPGLAPLANVSEEIRGVAATLPATIATRILGAESNLSATNPPANVQSVLASLPSVSMAHFSCHAQQDYNYPLSSAFILADGKLTVSDLMKLKMPEHTHFAFLSSCQSAAGDPTLPDEAIHLAGTMLYAGFKSVVATLWLVIFILSSSHVHARTSGL
jgi:CHAT domain-containing protein